MNNKAAQLKGLLEQVEAKSDKATEIVVSELQAIANNVLVTTIQIIRDKDPNRFTKYNGWGDFIENEFGIYYESLVVLANTELPDYEDYKPKNTQTASTTTSAQSNPIPPGTSIGNGYTVGFNFVITGTLSAYRADVERVLRAEGHYVDNRVTASTSYIIVGANPGQTKLNAAKKHCVPQITERQVLQMLGRTGW